MGQFLILLVVALVAAALVFGVVTLITGGDPGLEPAEPDGRAVPLPVSRPLREGDLNGVRFDTALRGYRMAQVDQAVRRAAYDVGYKEELINVLEAEVAALREGRLEDAEALRRARESASRTAPDDDPAGQPPAEPAPTQPPVTPAQPSVVPAQPPVAASDQAAEDTAQPADAAAGTGAATGTGAVAGADAASKDGGEPADSGVEAGAAAGTPFEVGVASGQPAGKADAQQ